MEIWLDHPRNLFASNSKSSTWIWLSYTVHDGFFFLPAVDLAAQSVQIWLDLDFCAMVYRFPAITVDHSYSSAKAYIFLYIAGCGLSFCCTLWPAVFRRRHFSGITYIVDLTYIEPDLFMYMRSGRRRVELLIGVLVHICCWSASLYIVIVSTSNIVVDQS